MAIWSTASLEVPSLGLHHQRAGADSFDPEAMHKSTVRRPATLSKTKLACVPSSRALAHLLVPPAELRVERRAAVRVLPICLSVLLAEFPDVAGFTDELLPGIPPYFRRDILRFTAAHDPLPNAKLYPLFEPEGHVDGELIIVGPQATLQRDHLLTLSPTTSTPRAKGYKDIVDGEEGPATSEFSNDAGVEVDGTPPDEYSWDVESSSQEVPPPLHTLVVLNSPIPATTLFAFPLILTRLALLALPTPTPVHRLPRICPLLEVVDLSYNPWLKEPPGGQSTENLESILQRIEWGKWARLTVLGLRGCDVGPDIVSKVNKGRWEEVHVVMEEHRTFTTTMSDVEAMMRSLRLND
ncbi:hypothetical protein BN946_scf184799.g9 [Trametes cinnabarina]|uniref:Uncharacterized protein n=1 Tax=Pycnoporus cinnabarinus TaxID=5643 RepID=A0A060S1S2_PYCCI|nr:hypothetical protein BN946_scf184799.g9 [Trametes cinnabarina]